MRAVIYARFSTELQSVASIEDQARLCRERATALALNVVAVHSDCAVSGATPVIRRPGASACVADATDAGQDVTLAGQTRASIPAIPGALQRCLTNLIDNAVKYGATRALRQAAREMTS